MLAKIKFSEHGAVIYSLKCLVAIGIDFESLGPILTKKSLNPSEISTSPDRIFPLLTKDLGTSLTHFFLPRRSLIVCQVFFAIFAVIFEFTIVVRLTSFSYKFSINRIEGLIFFDVVLSWIS